MQNQKISIYGCVSLKFATQNPYNQNEIKPR